VALLLGMVSQYAQSNALGLGWRRDRSGRRCGVWWWLLLVGAMEMAGMIVPSGIDFEHLFFLGVCKRFRSWEGPQRAQNQKLTYEN
jgi:hypothetical protein